MPGRFSKLGGLGGPGGPVQQVGQSRRGGQSLRPLRLLLLLILFLAPIGVQGDEQQTRKAFAQLRELQQSCKAEFDLPEFDHEGPGNAVTCRSTGHESQSPGSGSGVGSPV